MLFGEKHTQRYRETDGAEGHDWQGTQVLLLTTTGRKSGESRELPLIYGTSGDDYLIVASKGGADAPPAWYLNLQANPEVEVQVWGERFTAQARDATAEEAQTIPYPVDLALLKRGQDRYMIYCVPCHSPAGDGDGLVVRRGFPPPPSYHQDRLRNAPDRHLYDVISKGYGVMVPYGDRVEPADRWAIVAFIRALQLSQHADAATLPPDLRAHLDKAGGQP